MYRRIVSLTLLFGLMLAFTVPTTQAQQVRPEQTFFIKPRVGLSNYLGDNEKSPANFNFDLFKIDGKVPYNVDLELGYQFTAPFSLSAGYQLGNNPIITQFGNAEGSENNIDSDPTLRHTVQVIGRYTLTDTRRRVAPYLSVGAAYSFGDVRQPDGSESFGTAFGPLAGLGLDIAVNDRTSVFVESISSFSLSDSELDANADNGFGTADILTGIGMGLKINFKKAFTPVEVYAATCPAQDLVVGETGAFMAESNIEDASLPVRYTWDFGDGATGSGLTATHAYTEAGTYTATFTATNSGSTASNTCTVNVIAPIEVIAIVADKPTVSICDVDNSVTFTANVRGEIPMTYQWDFGDGTTSDAIAPTHVYETPGTYTVTLNVVSDINTETRTTMVTVTDEGCFNCTITEMNTVFFDKNSSVLTPQGRDRLQDNLEILLNCPTITGLLEGYAAQDERNPDALSTDRARAVKQFYIDNGVAADNVTAIGLGAHGESTKQGGSDQFRRVDTLPR